MKTKLLFALRITLIVCIICTLSFTFYQSSLSKESSTEQSDKVGGILGEIFPPDTPTGEFVQENVREIAHYTEFFFLGLFVSLYVCLFLPGVRAEMPSRIKFALLSLVISPIIPLVDETIQIFSDRGPEIADVWLDIFGYLSSSVIVYLIFFTVSCLVCRHKAANNETAD